MPKNPFPESDQDQHQIWDMLVRRDIEAYVAHDWPSHQSDFLPGHFFALDAGQSDNPDRWRTGFANLQSYAENWSSAAAASFGRLPETDLKAAIYAATTLRTIDINGDIATAHKKFDGTVVYSDGSTDVLNWQTLYFCKKQDARWWITGFIGFLPNPMGTDQA